MSFTQTLRSRLVGPGQRFLLMPVLPVVLFAVGYACCTGLDLFVRRRLHVALHQVVGWRINPGQFLLMLLAGAYAGARAKAFPGAKYANWLTLTPWSVPMPLPLNPPQLVLRDVAMLSIIAALSHFVSHDDPLLPLIAFGCVYLLGLMWRLLATRSVPAAYVLALGLAGELRLYPASSWMLLLLAALYPVAYLGLWQSLRRFPWEPKKKKPTDVKIGANATQGRTLPMSPVAPPDPISAGSALLVSVQAAWWLYCIAYVININFGHHQDRFEAALIAIGAGVFVAIIRASIYVNTHHAPISLWGRIWTLRFIIPRYDYVYIAPVLVFVLGVVIPISLLLTGYSPPAIVGTSAFIVLLAAITLGPTLRNWQLTGMHHVQIPRSGSRGAGDAAKQ